MKKMVYIRKFELENDGSTLYICFNESRKPLYTSRTLDAMLSFAISYVNKLNVEEFRIVYKGVSR